ncbi:hypothetical protein [Streptomyces sp. NBC_00356]|uniref:hypothetical protein n=1 Tax=Streptomyces sp. NBC_00356 TaxID=2975724 RepID=UPI002E25FC93
MTKPLRLEIDLNDRTPDNLVPAHLPDGVTVQPGQQVVAYEPEDQVAAPAVVRCLALGQALLDVNWNAMRDDASSRHIVGHATIGIDVAATQATGLEQTARVFAGLHRSAEADVSRVIDLYERWVKAGPPPLGTSISRWWDARLVELHDAILPAAHETGGQS